MATLAFGAIDIGGTKIAVGVCDAQGTLLAQARVPTRESGPEDAVRRAADALRACVAEAGVGSLTAVGVGCCGPLDSARGLILSPPNLPGWDSFPVASKLAAALDAPVSLENDANAAALGEHRFGAGVGVRDLVYVTVSTGIGAGVIVDGKLLRGVRDGAGEIGHATIDFDGPVCVCGNRGCLELFASGTAIARAAACALERGERSTTLEQAARGQTAHLTAADVAAAAGAGDRLAQAIWSTALDALAVGLGNAVQTLAPERLVVGGGVAMAGEDLFFEPLRERLRGRLKMVPFARHQLVPAKVVDDAGLLGAAAVALESWAQADRP